MPPGSGVVGATGAQICLHISPQRLVSPGSGGPWGISDSLSISQPSCRQTHLLCPGSCPRRTVAQTGGSAPSPATPRTLAAPSLSSSLTFTSGRVCIQLIHRKSYQCKMTSKGPLLWLLYSRGTDAGCGKWRSCFPGLWLHFSSRDPATGACAACPPPACITLSFCPNPILSSSNPVGLLIEIKTCTLSC